MFIGGVMTMGKTLALLLAAILLMVWTPAVADGYSTMLDKAERYFSSADYTKARASYQLAQKLQPDHVQAFLGEANVHIILEDYSSAASVIDTALEIDPVFPDTWYLKCKVDVLLSDITALEKDVVFAEVCDADLTDLYSQIASLYTSAGIYEKASLYFSKADLDMLDDAQIKQYRKALVLSGKREEAEDLGLVASPVRNTALDSAFENYSLTLIEAVFPAIAATDIEFPDEIWEAYGIEKPANPMAEVSAYIRDATITWLSLSPAGNSGILVANSDTGLCYYAGKYHALYPSHTRGVQDINENLAKVFSTRLQTLLGEEGVIYSPDGRYAAIFNNHDTLVRLYLIFDPIIIDLSTGEMFLSATYGNKPAKGNCGAVTTATFSSDGRYLYYMLYGNTAEYRTALYRYNLQEDTTEFCYSGSDLNYYPYLSETKDGTFVIMRDTIRQSESEGLTSISYKDGVWNGNDLSFDLPSRYWYCKRLMFSANSGYGFMPGKLPFFGAPYCAFQCVIPDIDFAGLNQYHVISKDSNQIQTYSAGEIASLIENWIIGSSQEDGSVLHQDIPFQEIMTSTLSPDGYYVLLNTVDHGSRDNPVTSRHLYLVRLDDLAIKEVLGIDPASIQAGAPDADYKPVIEWNNDTLIIGTKDGIKAYTFQFQ